MSQKKKLQVFVSSTYKDLQEERQAAVEAILRAGHIPAGMELFAAGDDSQMKVIRDWIDESDVYLLILGGRYGSVEKKSAKSYTHLEYEYAVEKGKRLFALVIEDTHIEEKVRQGGTGMIETEYADKLRKFRQLVRSRMVRFWSNPLEIKVAIMETLISFAQDPKLIGWIPGNEGTNPTVAEELARLTKENADLKLLVDKLEKQKYSGLAFTEMYDLLHKIRLSENEVFFLGKELLEKAIMIFGHSDPSLLHAFWLLSQRIQKHQGMIEKYKISRLLQKLTELRLIVAQKKSGTSRFYITDIGREFLLRLRLERNLEEAEKYILP